MAFPPLGNSDHVIVSIFVDFPSNSQQDALFHSIAYDYSHSDWDSLCDRVATNTGKLENTGILLVFNINLKNTWMYVHFLETTGEVLEKPLHHCIAWPLPLRLKYIMWLITYDQIISQKSDSVF